MSVAIQAEREPTYTPALAVLTSLFFVWGLLTSLNDILVPHLKAIFPYDSMGCFGEWVFRNFSPGGEIYTMLFLEFVNDVVDQALVEVFTA